jgi:hypothetical protein
MLQANIKISMNAIQINMHMYADVHWQYCAHKTQNEDKQDTKAQHNITQTTK